MTLKRNTNLVLIMLLDAPFHTAVFRSIPNVVQVNLEVKFFFQRDVHIEA